MRVTFTTVFLLSVASCGYAVPQANPYNPLARSGISMAGVTCGACTVIAGMVDQLSVVHKETHSKAFQRFCNVLPRPYSSLCSTFRIFSGWQITNLLAKGETPDAACIATRMCAAPAAGQPMCHLYPTALSKKSAPDVAAHLELLRSETISAIPEDRAFNPCKIPLIGDLLCSYLNVEAFLMGSPDSDRDQDGFSDKETLRGYAWRGKDCSDVSNNVYPGRKPGFGDAIVDSNCNGIKGYEQANHQLNHEDVLCSNSSAKGVVVLGDSVAANFHVPAQWFNASVLSADLYKNFTYLMENSFNWPQTSFYTGHENVTWSIMDGNTDSIYLRMRERNLCNHRDYQNLGQNGATIVDSTTYSKNLKRNPTSDKPALVIYSYIGNDVCRYHANPALDGTTSPAEARAAFLTSMQTLSTKLPVGSHVVVIGVADARRLYHGIHNQTHAFGSVRKDVTYGAFYDWLSCIGINPCAGWLNQDPYIQNITAQRTVAINEELQRTITELQGKYNNFDIVYIPNPIFDVIDAWEAKGGNSYELVEEFDGFHPNQKAHALVADAAWKYLERVHPEILGPVNPNNDRIKTLFGDQAGHR